jgi:CRP/FNR family cyclic AMP-dependent transcriptional regulator
VPDPNPSPAKHRPEANHLEAARTVLRSCSLFQHLSPMVRDKLVSRAKMRKFAARETIFLSGAIRDSLMAVMSGNVQISITSPGGKEMLLAILHPGEVFGEIALLDGRERSADARAMTDCNIAIIDRADVLAFLEDHPEAWRGFVEILCARLRNTDDHLVEVALLHLPARLARTVLRSANIRPDVDHLSTTTAIRLSQRELGNIVGASREQVNRWLQKWQREGILRIDKGTIVILDGAALRDVADELDS